jgi:hypothetical protein
MGGKLKLTLRGASCRVELEIRRLISNLQCHLGLQRQNSITSVRAGKESEGEPPLERKRNPLPLGPGEKARRRRFFQPWQAG